MRPGKEQPRWEANIFMARTGFKHDILRITLLDRDVPPEIHSLGIKERYYRSAMSIEMLSAEICWRTDLGVHMHWCIFKDGKAQHSPGHARKLELELRPTWCEALSSR